MASEQTHEEFMTSTTNQQPTGKSFGVRYTFPYDVYPRYSYLQSWTARLVPRFRQTIETNGLQECVYNGYVGLEKIKEAEKCLGKPIVTVFSETKSLIRKHKKALVTTFEPFEYEKLSSDVLVWNDVVNEGNGSSDYDSKVLVVIAKDTDTDMFEKLSGLSQVQKESTLVYNPSTKSHYFYKTKENSGLETMNNSTSLSHAIQTVLELKVVTLLEKIASYMEPLVPRDSIEPDTSLLEVITDKLKQFEKCCRIHVERVSRTSEYQAGDQAVDNQNHTQEETIKSLVDIPISLPLQKYQIEELIKVIGRRTKCQIVEQLSMEFGIHPMVLTSFLSSEKFFNFDGRYSSWITGLEIDKLGTVKTIFSESEARITQLVQDIADYVKSQYEQLEEIQKQQFELFGIIRQSVFDVKVKLQTKLTPKLQDEILSLEEVSGCGTIFGILTLHVSKELAQSSTDVLKQLLRKYNYYRRYRVRVVSMQKRNHIQCGSALQAEIKDDLKRPSQEFKHGTIGCFVDVKENLSGAGAVSTSGNLDENSLHANNGTNDFTREQVIFTDESGDHRTGENGQRLSQSGSRENLMGTTISNGLHCITCRHCVKDCKDEVTTGDGNFAVQTHYLLEEGAKFDIALLRVHKSRIMDCDLRLPGNREGNIVSNVRYPWRIFDDSTNLDSRPVYKYGCTTGDTYGVVASNNFWTVGQYNDVLSRTSNTLEKMDPNVNIIIESSQSPFSEDGDSGAIICDKVINENVVTAIAIVQGAFLKDNTWLCTYASRLRSSFDELGRRYGIDIQPPAFRNAINNEDRPPPLQDLPYDPNVDEEDTDDEPLSDWED